MKVLCIGQATYDITLPVEKYPIENKKIKTTEKVECGGGSASNVAYLLSQWQIESYFAGTIGEDYYGQKIVKEFSDIGINTKYLQTDAKIATPTSYIINNQQNGSRTIITNRNNNSMIKNIELKENFDIIFLDGYEEELAKKAIQRNPNAIKIIDAGSLNERTVNLSKLCDYVVCSKDFAEDYTKMKVDYDDLDTIVEIYEILNKNFKGKIIITLEEKGSFLDYNGYKIIPSIEVEAVDSTGAGDIFHGAFVYCIANNFDLIKTIKISNISGGLSTLNIGARYSIPTLDKVMEIYNELITRK